MKKISFISLLFLITNFALAQTEISHAIDNKDGKVDFLPRHDVLLSASASYSKLSSDDAQFYLL